MRTSSITPLIDEAGERLTVALTGPFDFNVHRRFKQVITETKARFFVVDLTGIDYIDSAGLGMILQLKEHATTRGGKLSVIALTGGPVRHVLELAHFDQLVEIVEPEK
ncbi:MAG: STAS domain-containing protein [Myxococcota bacterium]